MNKLKILLPILLILLLLAVPAMAEEAENLTAGLTMKVVDKPGKTGAITDGSYKSYWESSEIKGPWVVISSDKPIYGLYLCFRQMPETYVIQKANGDDWVTVAEGGEPRYHHVFFELDGLKKIRILSTMEKKQAMGFNEIYAFGAGEVPDWVQRWEEPVEKADLLFLVAHPDDELLFTGGAIPTYAVEKGRNVAVAYLSFSNTTRRSEALNGLWAMGIRNYPVFGPFSDRYAKTGKAKDAYKEAGGKQKVLDWVNELYRRFRPEVVVTHAEDGEYGHPQHKMVADAAKECFALAADPVQSPESYQAYGTWQVKKLYLHLYGEGADQTVLDWDQPLSAFNGKTGAELAAEAFALHVTQKGMGTKIRGKFVEFTVEDTGRKMFPYDHFGLQSTTVGPDEAKNDFLEHIGETENPAATDEQPEETETTELTGGTEDADEPERITVSFSDVTPPEWADVTLNDRGFLDEGEYIFADSENGHYMYVNRTLRIVIERTYEVPDRKHPFYCFTANVWCDIENGEYPQCVFNNPDPEQRNKSKNFAFIKDIAANSRAVLATSTDYYTYRISQPYPTGIEIRNGEIIINDPRKLQRSMPTYETLALYRDGHAESWSNEEKSAEEYIRDGALQVYTFGPCLVKNGELTEYILNRANESYNPRLAMGVAEPGHYVLVMCEGRIARSKGVQMRTLAKMMLERGCRLAVNLDGGQSAVITFMGKQLNQVVKSDPKGRLEGEILAFGFSDQVGTFELPGAYDFEIAK
ncbi:MAG: phosphodiester glycosidase family protein [Clostridiales bacterium]|nr:phosphodiester glycosidase family protein [Clostridiales bacterium]